MLKALVLSLALPLVLFSGSFAHAAECPVEMLTDGYLDNVEKAIASKTSCYEAVEIAESCAMGSSMDSAIAGTAEVKCTATFQKKLNRADARTYASLQKKCNDKYKDMQGTMYISAAAFCRLNVSQLYSNLYTPAE